MSEGKPVSFLERHVDKEGRETMMVHYKDGTIALYEEVVLTDRTIETDETVMTSTPVVLEPVVLAVDPKK